jgi:hypothetical protein
MTKLTEELIARTINEQITANSEAIGKLILSSTDNSMTYEQIYSTIIFNSINISTTLSVKIILELLFQSGLIEELDTKTLLKHLQH